VWGHGIGEAGVLFINGEEHYLLDCFDVRLYLKWETGAGFEINNLDAAGRV